MLLLPILGPFCLFCTLLFLFPQKHSLLLLFALLNQHSTWGSCLLQRLSTKQSVHVFTNTSFLFFSVGKLRSFQRPGPLLIFLVETSLRPFWIGRLMYSPVPGMPQRLYPKLLGPSLGLLCKVRGWRPYKSHFQSRFCKALGLPPKRFAS